MPPKIALPYTTFGKRTAQTPSLAFHGFGQHAQVFQALGKSQFTFAFDLPFHGKHPMPYNNKAAFLALFDQFFNTFPQQQYHIIAFSIGCRLAYTLVNHFPERIQSIILIAPEGLRFHPIYRIAVHPGLGNWLFRKVMKGSLLEKTVATVSRFKLFPKGLTDLVKSQVRSKKHRERVFHTWMAHRDFAVQVSQLAKTMQQHDIRIQFVLGKFDKIIQYKHISPLCEALGDYPQDIQWLACGHSNLLKSYLEKSYPS